MRRHYVHTCRSGKLGTCGEDGSADWRAPADEIGDDWATEFQDRAAPVRAAWRAADLDSLVAGPGGEAALRRRADQQITELAAHDWDLARATAQDVARLDPAL